MLVSLLFLADLDGLGLGGGSIILSVKLGRFFVDGFGKELVLVVSELDESAIEGCSSQIIWLVHDW